MRISSDQRNRPGFPGELQQIRRRPKFDATAKGALELAQVRLAHVDEGDSCRPNGSTRNFSQSLENNCDLKLDCLSCAMSGNPHKAKLDGLRPSPPDYGNASAVVDDSAIARQEVQALTQIRGGGNDIE